MGHHRLAALLIADLDTMPVSERNQARFVVLDSHAGELYANSEQVAADTAATLRSHAGRH